MAHAEPTKKKVLVCGATGFIGRNITERLCQRDDLEVHAVHFKRPPYDCPNVTWHHTDLRKGEELEPLLKDIDVLIQAAATTSGAGDIVNRPHIHVTDNALINSLLLRAAFEKQVGHFIFFSCSIMHQSSEQPLTENDWDANADMSPAYFGTGWTKVYIEKMCDFFAAQGNTKHTVIRHSNIYGPHDKFDLERSHVFGASLTKCLGATGGKVSVWGSGEEERDLLYVDDLVDFIERAMERQEQPFELFNVGAGHGVSISDLVSKIITASGQSLEIDFDLTKPTIKTSINLNCDKAKKMLGWKPETSLEKGIEKTIAWWRNNIPSE